MRKVPACCCAKCHPLTDAVGSTDNICQEKKKKRKRVRPFWKQGGGHRNGASLFYHQRGGCMKRYLRQVGTAVVGAALNAGTTALTSLVRNSVLAISTGDTIVF